MHMRRLHPIQRRHPDTEPRQADDRKSQECSKRPSGKARADHDGQGGYLQSGKRLLFSAKEIHHEAVRQDHNQTPQQSAGRGKKHTARAETVRRLWPQNYGRCPKPLPELDSECGIRRRRTDQSDGRILCAAVPGASAVQEKEEVPIWQ